MAVFPSHSLAVPLTQSASAALGYLDAVLREQPRAAARWPSERARLSGSVSPTRIVLRLGTRHRWVVFVGALAEGGLAIRGVFKVSFPERLLFAVSYALLGTVAVLGIASSILIHGSPAERVRLIAVGLAVLILGFFATRISWLGRRAHVVWIADLIRRAARGGS